MDFMWEREKLIRLVERGEITRRTFRFRVRRLIRDYLKECKQREESVLVVPETQVSETYAR